MWFEPLLGPNFMPNFRKIVRAVSEINPSQTDERTNGRTDGTDSISPFGLQPGTNNYICCMKDFVSVLFLLTGPKLEDTGFNSRPKTKK